VRAAVAALLAGIGFASLRNHGPGRVYLGKVHAAGAKYLTPGWNHPKTALRDPATFN
jgi:hypothetical protein